MLDKIKRIGNFPFAFSILKSIRAKIEYQKGFDNRIGSSFKDGFKGVLAVGSAGGGKTTTLKAIFDNFGLNNLNEGGFKKMGKWIPSGLSTGVGLFELFIENNDGIIVMDELDCSSTQHIHIMKQVASGQISRLKSQSIEPTPFSGILWGATNGVSLSKKNMSHIVAMLERFTLVNIKPSNNQEESLFDNSIDAKDPLLNDDWVEIISHLTSDCSFDLNADEREWGKKLFAEKKKESLDPSKALYRQAQDVIDIMLFTKRFFQCEDLLADEELKAVVEEMVQETVHCNPVKVLQLSTSERDVYSFIEKDGSASFDNLVLNARTKGYLISNKRLRTLLDKMVDVRILNKYSNDIYSIKNMAPEGKVGCLAKFL